MERTSDVIVLGAGLAGLAAAVRLEEQGLRVLVVEARDRVGGRVHSVEVDGSPLAVELGAEFVHGDAPLTVELASQSPLALIDVPGSHWRRLDKHPEELERFKEGLTVTFGKVRRTLGGREDRSLAQAVREARVREPARSQVLAYVEGFQASDPERISARALAGDDLGTERVRRLLPRYDALTQRLRERLRERTVRLGSVAERVRWKRGRVEVQGRMRAAGERWSLRGERLLVTLPLGVLQAGAAGGSGLRFEPALPQKERALRKLAMGAVAKIHFRFREAFWEDRKLVRAKRGDDLACLGFLHAPGLAVPTWWTQRPIHVPALTAWAGGPSAERLLRLGEAARIERSLEALAGALGIPAALPRRLLVGWRSHDWSADPDARGAYSYPLVGGARAAAQLARPLERTLFFAGEATCAPPANGTVEGALESGARAAAEILRASRA